MSVKYKNNKMTNGPKPLNKYIRKEIHDDKEDSMNQDDEMTDIPEYWKYMGICCFTNRI